MQANTPRAEQVGIIKRLEDALGAAEATEVNIVNQQGDTVTIRQSILAAAFRGDFVQRNELQQSRVLNLYHYGIPLRGNEAIHLSRSQPVSFGLKSYLRDTI